MNAVMDTLEASLDDEPGDSFLRDQFEFEQGVAAIGALDKGTVTLSTKDRSVTVTGKQFSNAARGTSNPKRGQRKVKK